MKQPIQARRNRYWASKLYGEARWIHSFTVAEAFGGVSFGHRRYFRRRMSDLARILKQRYGVGVEEVA
jgi:hypothetical protein